MTKQQLLDLLYRTEPDPTESEWMEAVRELLAIFANASDDVIEIGSHWIEEIHKQSINCRFRSSASLSSAIAATYEGQLSISRHPPDFVAEIVLFLFLQGHRLSPYGRQDQYLYYTYERSDTTIGQWQHHRWQLDVFGEYKHIRKSGDMFC